MRKAVIQYIHLKRRLTTLINDYNKMFNKRKEEGKRIQRRKDVINIGKKH